MQFLSLKCTKIRSHLAENSLLVRKYSEKDTQFWPENPNSAGK